jgi:modulator of FtsH protease
MRLICIFAAFTGERLMTEQIINNTGFGSAVNLQERNRVLRNTYWLLALSLIPTVLGAWLGVSTGITKAFMGGWMGFIVFMGGALAFNYAIHKTKNSAAGVPVLLAFTFFMGLMLSGLIDRTLNYKNGATLIMTAFGGTAGVFFVMASLSTIIKRDLTGLGKWLSVGTIVLLVAGIISMLTNSSAGMIAFSVAAIGIFSAYMLYDLKQIVDGGETNYISATQSLYLDIFIVFQNLLSLLGIFGGERD